ncbi:hypothetical protein GF402_01305 [Candidatus Fermentibacteria bacterium]|nr:hypothetical protein [Candidatus Fermentibacteria bacterium]
MRPLNLLALLVLPVLGLAASPEEGFETFLDAVYDGDTEAFLSCLSQGNRDQLDMLVMMIRLSPQEAAEQLSSQLGQELPPEEIEQWTSLDLVELILNSQQLRGNLPARSDVLVVRCETSGDSATVYLSVSEAEEEFPLLMVLEEEVWKLGESFL